MYIYILLFFSIITKILGFLNVYLIKAHHPKFKLLKNKILCLPFIHYTTSSIYVLLFWIYNKIYYENVSSNLTSLVWCLLSTVTIGYWSLIKNDNSIPKYNIFMSDFSNFMHHGGILLLFSPYIIYHPFSISSVYLSILFSLGWLLFVILPWYYLTDDSVYSFLDKNNMIFKKIIIFVIMLFINIFNCILGSLLLNKFKIIY